MEISSSSGKSSSSGNSPAGGKEPWELLESGAVAWPDMSPRQQESVVRHYAPKIKFLALRLKAKLPKNVELGELISAGTLGLMESLGKFDPKMGIKFDTYAESRIRGAMLDELRRLDWFPRSLRHRVRQLEEAIHKIESDKGRVPTEEELQQATGLDEKEVRIGLEALQNQLCLSLDAIQETFSTEGRDSIDGEPFQATALQELIERVASLIDQLTPREKLVLSLYYSDELNMRETAEVMGITEGRVSQLHTQALQRLRREFHTSYGTTESI
ncbi:FliA/WhiG family RNA polymerase sigma factor [Desulfovibrio mangrovi]|uniref:FliA/WhiG family RNA polymerase sigma factor n=1 Tax=Desulfovibrio mangrovi TaxID=2976983 RepID=UPI0022468EAF|nr:FliA/WhiG family RNA polymerase sigma factor [Desulfovibrio mangrovi]UZP69181.1 FliA/WhiG family RNA polymerase sigma factor [Desulfovibrio mangrovi]